MELYGSLERIDSSAKDSITLALPKNLPKESIQESRVPRLVPPLVMCRLCTLVSLSHISHLSHDWFDEASVK
jgi:hypothetical protein